MVIGLLKIIVKLMECSLAMVSYSITKAQEEESLSSLEKFPELLPQFIWENKNVYI